MFGDSSALNNALLSVISATNFSDLFASSGAAAYGNAGTIPPLLAANNGYCNNGENGMVGGSASAFYAGGETSFGGSPAALRALGDAEQIFAQFVARRQQQQRKSATRQLQDARILTHDLCDLHSVRDKQPNLAKPIASFAPASGAITPRQKPPCDVFVGGEQLRENESRNGNGVEYLLSPPPSYSDVLAMAALAPPSSSMGSSMGSLAGIASPDISRLAADTTAVTLRDEHDDAQLAGGAFARPNVGERIVASSMANASTISSSGPMAYDKPLDLSLKRGQRNLTRGSGPCTSSPSPSNSSISSFDSNSNASTPSKSSLLHNYVGHHHNRVGEVKRSASSVTYRNPNGVDFDADVAEHFRRSLSGKWPRRQLNYAHYASPTSGGGAKSLNTSVGSLSMACGGGGGVGGAPAAGLCSIGNSLGHCAQFASIDELRATTTTATTTAAGQDVSAASGIITAPSTSLQRSFAEKFENNVFARKNSLTARYVPQKVVQNSIAGLSPSSKVIWRKKSNASTYSNATTATTATSSDYGNAGSVTPSESPAPRANASVNAGTAAKKSATKNSIIIINQAHDVEDHFRMALGDKAFQELKRAQNQTPTPTRHDAAATTDTVADAADTAPIDVETTVDRCESTDTVITSTRL